jgi:ParB family chromosome partitioning protein
VAERVGRSRVAITNTLRLLGAADAVQAALQEERITEGHARALLGLPTAIDQVAMLRELEEHGWNVRQTEEAVRKWVAAAASRQETERAAAIFDRAVHVLEDRLQRLLATKVTVRRPPGAESGALTIHFFSEEQLNAIITRLAGEEDW